ncbi:MAG: PIN domain-containing protein [Archaeoglobaceae archaeon]
MKILLDSTYLLPAVGVSVSNSEKILETLEWLRKSKKAEFYYSEFSILEIIAKVAKTNYDEEVVALGLQSIFENLKEAKVGVKAYLMALKLKSEFRDFIDLLLLLTADENGIKLLTRDRELKEFAEKLGKGNVVLSEEEICVESKKIQPNWH